MDHIRSRMTLQEIQAERTAEIIADRVKEALSRPIPVREKSSREVQVEFDAYMRDQNDNRRSLERHRRKRLANLKNKTT